MKKHKQLVLYIIINIVISAATTLAVLFWWENFRTPSTLAADLDPAGPIQSNLPIQAAETTDISQIEVSRPILIEINNIFGVGEISTEFVLIKNVANEAVSVTGWQLKDQQGHSFVFPELKLLEGGFVKVYTKTGINSALELYWNLPEAIWHTGETATLVDSTGNITASYQVP
jgi:hypothetical protein